MATDQPIASNHSLALLGKQLQLALNAYQLPHGQHFCSVRQEKLTGLEILGGSTEPRRFMAFDSLPGSINIKAIGLDEETLFLEITPYDPDGITQAQAEVEMPKGVLIDASGMFYKKRKLATVLRGSREVEKKHGARALWTVSRSLTPELMDMVIATFDALDISGAYDTCASDDEPNSSESFAVPPTGKGKARPEMRLEMRLGLQMELIQTQVPIMALRVEQRLEQRMEMRPDMLQTMELRQMQRFEAWLQRDPEDAIIQALTTDPSPNGQKRVADYIQFAMARTVKNAAAADGRELSWRESRKIARKIMRSQPTSP